MEEEEEVQDKGGNRTTVKFAGTRRHPRGVPITQTFLSCFTIADVVLLAQPFAAGVKDTPHLPPVINFCGNFTEKVK